jgi:ABC-type phosphate/phosphonate transport system permease subunit
MGRIIGTILGAILAIWLAVTAAARLVLVPRSFCLKQLSRLSQLRSQPTA